MRGAGSLTNTSAVAVLPVPPFVDVTLFVVLVFKPAVEPVTVTLNVQEPLAAIVPTDNAIVPVPAVVVILFIPPQALKVPVATVKPAGKTSVNATPVSAVPVFGLLIVNVSVVVLPVKMGFAVNALLMTGGSITVSEEVPMPLEVVLGPVSVEI